MTRALSSRRAWTHVRGGEKIPYSAASTELYGMRDEDVGDKSRFREIADEVKEMLAGADIGGYAVVGDVQIIERRPVPQENALPATCESRLVATACSVPLLPDRLVRPVRLPLVHPTDL